MKEDYLWDKTGNDPEVEKLENLLLHFRHGGANPPVVVSAAISPVAETPKRKLFRLSFAFASFAVLTLISLGLWLQFNDQNPETEALFSGTSATDEKAIPDDGPTTADSAGNISKPEPIEAPQFASANEREARKRSYARIPKRNSRQAVRQNPEPAVLTDEEKYAYNQLMLALSITSSKLKYVKDAIESVDKPQVILKKDDEKRRN